MYSNVRTCIRFNGFNSDSFCNNLVSMQGEVLTPILFSFYVNDFEIAFIANGKCALEFQKGLQEMLSTLSIYT